MQDRFYAKTWIFWAQAVLLGSFGAFAVVFGSLFWTGTMRDAFDQPRPAAGPPMLIIGCILLGVAAMAAFNIVARSAPLIRCYREGVECKLVGATSLDVVPMVPRIVRLAWAIITLQGFRSARWRIPWQEFAGAHVSGIPMAYVLTLRGRATSVTTGLERGSVSFAQAALRDRPQQVAELLNAFASKEGTQGLLPSWSA